MRWGLYIAYTQVYNRPGRPTMHLNVLLMNLIQQKPIEHWNDELSTMNLTQQKPIDKSHWDELNDE